MSSILTDRGIVYDNYNGRGLLTYGADVNNAVRTADGTLWVALRENLTNHWINIYRSDDRGFSWVRAYQGNLTQPGFRKAGLTGINHNGNFMHLTWHEHEKRLILWHAYWDAGTSEYGVEPFIFDVNPNGDITRTTSDDDGAGATDTYESDHDLLAIDVVHNDDTIFLTTIEVSKLKVRAFKPYVQIVDQGEWSIGDKYFNVFSTVVDEYNQLHVVILKEEDSRYRLIHRKLDKASGQFTDEHTIELRDGKYDVIEVSLDMDAHGILCCTYTNITADSKAVARYAISKDNGVTWTVANIPSTEGQASYTDAIMQSDTAKTTVLGGIGGFVLSYVRDYESVPTTYVRSLLRDDAGNYTLGEQRYASLTTRPVAGARFFRSPSIEKQDLSDLGEVRVAYQVGEGNSTIQLDTVPVDIGQHLLKHSAYPDTAIEYIEEQAGDNQVLITVDVIGSPLGNIDYYAKGLTGKITERYVGAFERVGNKMKLERYEPDIASFLDDRTAYTLEGISIVDAVFDVDSYDLPFLPEQDHFDQFIERDIRKIYLPPTQHLSREFVLNQGNYLKRTVWITYYDGNAYELTQVVPYFIHDEICLYTANAYVIGPSHDPFSRVILPSET